MPIKTEIDKHTHAATLYAQISPRYYSIQLKPNTGGAPDSFDPTLARRYRTHVNVAERIPPEQGVTGTTHHNQTSLLSDELGVITRLSQTRSTIAKHSISI